MRLYHGSGQYDKVIKQGLKWDEAFRNDFDDEGKLASLGGIYLVDSLEVAAYYATKAVSSEVSLGMDPCIFVVEVEDDILIPDEDKLWAGINKTAEELSLKMFESDADDIAQAFHIFIETNPNALDIFADRLCVKKEDDWKAVVHDGVKAFMIREHCWDWCVDYPEHKAAISAINELSRLATATVSRNWISKYFGSFALTCRTFEPITPDDNDTNCIVGSICLRMSDDGLVIENVETTGDVDPDDVDDFIVDFAEKTWELSGCQITSESTIPHAQKLV